MYLWLFDNGLNAAKPDFPFVIARCLQPYNSVDLSVDDDNFARLQWAHP